MRRHLREEVSLRESIEKRPGSSPLVKFFAKLHGKRKKEKRVTSILRRKERKKQMETASPDGGFQRIPLKAPPEEVPET